MLKSKENQRLTRPNLINLPKVSSDTHLLGQLRALRQRDLSSEIINDEHARTALAPSRLELARMDLRKVAFVKIGARRTRAGCDQSEDGMRDGSAEGEGWVSEERVEAYAGTVRGVCLTLKETNDSKC